MNISAMRWRSSKLLFFRFFFLFVAFFIVSFSFGYYLLPDIGQYTQRVFQTAASWTGDHIFHLQRPYIAELISDSTGFYLNVFNILVFAALVATGWGLLSKKVRSHDQLLYWFTAFVRYYLALQLFIYGCSKLFKVQFYLPEPNILYTRLGQVPRDLLYWSTMGVSRPYNIFLGMTEVIAGALLLFRKSSLAGAFFSFFILINVVVINFAYDISVKLLSCFLLALSVYLLALQAKRIARFFSGQSTPPNVYWKPGWIQPRRKSLYRLSKAIVISLILSESLWAYIRAGNFDDDAMARPYFHGAYSVETFILNGDTLPPLLTDTLRWKRVFFHRHGYFITETMNEDMQDYEMSFDTTRKEISINLYKTKEPITFSYHLPQPGFLILEGRIRENQVKAILQKLDLRQLPLLKKEFNWTTDNGQ